MKNNAAVHKRILLLCVFLVLFLTLSIIYFYVDNDARSPPPKSINFSNDGDAPTTAAPTNKAYERKPVDPPAANTTSDLEQKNAAEITRWFASKGHFEIFGLDDQNDYKNYDISTLENLAKNGDIHAMHELALKQESLSKRRDIFYGAAVYGSTAALMDIGTSVLVEANLAEKSEEEKKGFILESLSFYQAAHLRGDSWVALNAGSSTLNLHPTNLTPSDVEYIKKRGKEIYSELQEHRNQLNLGEFDNSVPAAAKQFIDKYRKETNSDEHNAYFNSIFNE